jgi:hypothetical protein
MSVDRCRLAPVAGVCVLVATLASCGTTVDGKDVTTGSLAGASGLSAPSAVGTTADGTGEQTGNAAGAGGSGAGLQAGSTGIGGTSNGTGITGPTDSTAAASGPNHAPIRLGLMYANNDAASTAGINNNMDVTADKVMKALVGSYNSQGGLAGRKIQPYYTHLNSSSQDYESDLAASCAALTQDDRVSVVINSVGLYSENLQSCLAKAHLPVVSDLGPDQQDAKQFPLMVTPDDLLADTRVVQVVQRLKASGWLTPKNKIGVVVEDCPVDNRIFTNTLKPALARAGLTLAATANPQCFQAIQDLGTISSQMGSAVVNFRANGVDRVLFVSLGEEGTMCYEFMLAAGQQNWYPGYAMSSMTYATTVATQSGVKQQEIENSRGIGWSPPTDTADLKQAPPGSAAKDCLARLAKEGVRPTTPNDLFASWSVCDQFSLLDRILRATGGDASPGGFLHGLAAAGQGYVSALTVAGSMTTWDRGRLGPGAFRYFGWVNSKSAFAYTSNPVSF